MTRALIALLATLAFAGAARAASAYPGVEDRSLVSPEARLMEITAVIAAPRPVLWRALTEASELKKWNCPVAFTDIRPGGSMETSYDPKAARGDRNNIKQQILAVEPERILVFRNVQAPEGLPGRERISRVTTSVRFEDAGPGRTRVTLYQVGYGGGDEDKVLWDFFRTGNAYVLAEMNHVYGGGPKPQMPDGH